MGAGSNSGWRKEQWLAAVAVAWSSAATAVLPLGVS